MCLFKWEAVGFICKFCVNLFCIFLFLFFTSKIFIIFVLILFFSAPKTPEKRKEIMQHGSETHSQSRIPMPSGELEYTLTLGKVRKKTPLLCIYVFFL